MMPPMQHVIRVCASTCLLLVSSPALAQQLLLVADEGHKRDSLSVSDRQGRHLYLSINPQSEP